MEQKALRRIAGAVGPIVAGALALGVGLANPHRANADAASVAKEKAERCATRLSIAFLGASPTAAQLAAADPQAAVASMLGADAFIERFARFTNAEMNPEPGTAIAEDASYTLAKYVLANDKPWKEMFVGAYDVADTVTADPNGLGYFRSAAWMRRFAGDEENGYRIVSAYRILQNTTGLVLTATTNVAGADLTATGREAAACRGCHYEKWYALDKVARVLSKKQVGAGGAISFTAPADGPQQLLGKTITNDKELVTALVDSADFRVNAVRLAFKYLYGREETTCEGTVFDKAIVAFDTKGSMKDAVAAIAKDPTFCQ